MYIFSQSLVRKSVKSGDGARLMEVAGTVTTKLLSGNNSLLLGMASQLLLETADAMLEVRLEVNEKNLNEFYKMDEMFANGLDALPARDAIQDKQRCKYLAKALRWTDLMGTVRFGELKMHSALASAMWNAGDRAESISHSAFAEEPEVINERLSSVDKKGEKDLLLCRAVLTFLTAENLRDANALSDAFIKSDGRNFEKLATEFFAKEKKIKSFVIFCTSVLGIVEREQKAGALYTWLLGKFQGYLQRFPELLPFTSRIGQIYFNIQPPPSMLKQMESMMAMMGGMGGMGGLPPGMMMPGGF